MRNFDMMRACFLLIAFIVVCQMVATTTGGLLCFWLNLRTVATPGACMMVAQQIREQWSEMMTAVLALLLAFRRPPSDKE